MLLTEQKENEGVFDWTREISSIRAFISYILRRYLDAIEFSVLPWWEDMNVAQ
jgi:hypothetical protein